MAGAATGDRRGVGDALAGEADVVGEVAERRWPERRRRRGGRSGGRWPERRRWPERGKMVIVKFLP